MTGLVALEPIELLYHGLPECRRAVPDDLPHALQVNLSVRVPPRSGNTSTARSRGHGLAQDAFGSYRGRAALGSAIS